VRDGRVAARARVLGRHRVHRDARARVETGRPPAHGRCSTRAATRSARIEEAARPQGRGAALLDDFKKKHEEAVADRRGHRRACPQRGRPHRRRGRQHLEDSLKRREQMRCSGIAQGESQAIRRDRDAAVGSRSPHAQSWSPRSSTSPADAWSTPRSPTPAQDRLNLNARC